MNKIIAIFSTKVFGRQVIIQSESENELKLPGYANFDSKDDEYVVKSIKLCQNISEKVSKNQTENQLKKIGTGKTETKATEAKGNHENRATKVGAQVPPHPRTHTRMAHARRPRRSRRHHRHPS